MNDNVTEKNERSLGEELRITILEALGADEPRAEALGPKPDQELVEELLAHLRDSEEATGRSWETLRDLTVALNGKNLYCSHDAMMDLANARMRQLWALQSAGRKIADAVRVMKWPGRPALCALGGWEHVDV